MNHCRSVASLAVAACALLAAAPSPAQESGISFKSTELASGLYMLEGEGGFTGGNLGLLTGEDGTVLIDDGIEPLAEDMLAAVNEIAGVPVDFVINTHVQLGFHQHGKRHTDLLSRPERTGGLTPTPAHRR